MSESFAGEPVDWDELVAWRRHLHANPELSLHERETAAFMGARLAELGVPFTGGVGGHGVVATLTRGSSNRCVGLRADLDALPIQEETGLSYASTRPGVMHACGHDGHATSLLGAAALLARDSSWSGTVHFVFQPAEEGKGGARSMIGDRLFERFPMERIFGFHNWPGLAAGTAMIHDGPVMAAGARILITLEGRAGHAAQPHLTRDPMIAAAHLLLAMQTIVSRNVDPLDSAVVSMTVMETGEAANQIPQRVAMRGTMRTLRGEVRDLVEESVRRLSGGVAQTFGMQESVKFMNHVVLTANGRAEAELARAAAREAGLPVRDDMPPAMTSEDFGWYLQERPGAFIWIGNGEATACNTLHNPGYDFNDAILPKAARYLAAVAKQALAG